MNHNFITMLGTGNAMATRCYNTCFVLGTATSRCLVDAGGGKSRWAIGSGEYLFEVETN